MTRTRAFNPSTYRRINFLRKYSRKRFHNHVLFTTFHKDHRHLHVIPFAPNFHSFLSQRSTINRQTLIVPRLAQLSFSFHKILIRLNIHGNKISNNLIFHRLISQTIIIDSTVPYIKPPTILHLVPFLVADGYPFFPSIGDRILADPRISWVLAVRNDNDSG